jgi:ketosteroid isomerase-like protein
VTASANLDLVRSIYVAWERGDWSWTEWADPEIEVLVVDGPSPGRWTGLAGMVESTRDFISAWEGYRIEADEYREVDDERILVLYHRSGGRGKTSGLELKQLNAKGAHVLNFRNGKVVRHVTYFDRERALADLGLAPEGGAP